MSPSSGSSDELASVRGDLSNCRKALLQLLLDTGCDVIQLDEERVIRKTEVVTSRRITKQLMLEVLQELVGQLQGETRRLDPVSLFGIAKWTLLRHVDRSIPNGNVVPTDSKEAKKRRRDSAELVVGGPELVSATMRGVADTYWEAIERQRVINDEARRHRRAPRVADPPDPPLDQGEDAISLSGPEPPPLPAPSAGEGPGRAPGTPAGPSARAAPPARRARPSVSKTEAYKILQRVAEHLVGLSYSTFPPWGDIKSEMESLVDEAWIGTL